MTRILIFSVLMFSMLVIFIYIIFANQKLKRQTAANPVLLRTGNKIYFFDEGIRAARVVMNLRQDERLLIRTIGRKKERLTIDYSQVLEIKR